MQEVPFNPAARGFQYVSERISSTLKEEGDRLELVVFMPDLSRCVKQVSTLSTLENGLRQIENRLEVAPGNSLVSTDWVDDKGKAVRSSMPYLNLETVLSSREEILAADFSSPPEIFISSAIPLGRFLGWKRQEIVYQLRIRDKNQPIELRESGAAGHELTAAGEKGAWRLKVRAVDDPDARTLPLDPNPLPKRYLASTAYLQVDDSRLNELTKKVIGEEKNSLKAARQLEKWVYNYIHKKTSARPSPRRKRFLKPDRETVLSMRCCSPPCAELEESPPGLSPASSTIKKTLSVICGQRSIRANGYPWMQPSERAVWKPTTSRSRFPLSIIPPSPRCSSGSSPFSAIWTSRSWRQGERGERRWFHFA